MVDKEIAKLVEKRQVQASLRRITLKISTVLNHLGHKIRTGESCGTGLSQNFLQDYYYSEEEEEVPTYEGEAFDIGLYYDTLHLGKNFEMRLLTHDGELKASFNGYTVYKEINGDLVSYVPDKEWEDLLDRLFDQATAREQKQFKEEKEEKKFRLTREVGKLMTKLIETWGRPNK